MLQPVTNVNLKTVFITNTLEIHDSVVQVLIYLEAITMNSLMCRPVKDRPINDSGESPTL